MRAQQEPIAIVGIGCRFPGGADSPASFWRVLRDGVDAIAEIPEDRPELRELYDPTPGTPGRITARVGGFLSGLDLFEPSFFGISPREASAVDPQQRILLETSWEAFEDAGIVPASVAGRSVGVFIGMWTNEYEDRMFAANPDIDLYVTTGGGRYAASGRLSFAFDLRGPSLTLDTACSSSLVAVHLACQSLRSGECELALAGASNLILAPHISIGYSRSRMLSTDGRCKFGDASANGYVRSEGVGVLLLKPLSRALADGDPIHALVRGSAVNNDGRSSGLLVAPGVGAQQDMLKEAYENAGVDPARVGYLEAHGTGTGVGDPVEIEALAAVLGQGRAPDQPCAMGSVKTNIGHTEAASGLAGLIKAALCLEHGQIPPSLHFQNPNPKIPWDRLPLQIQTSLVPWPEGARPAYAGVNSFGVTGTNAHVVLAGADMPAPIAVSAEALRPHVLTLSARSPAALVAEAQRWQEWLRAPGDEPLRDLAYTAARRRSHLDHRLTVVGRDREAWAESLDIYARGEAGEGISAGPAREGAHRVVFVFPGQGGQWLGMGRQLFEREPVFRAEIERWEQAFRAYVGWSLSAELLAGASASHQEDISVVQPTLFAVEVALAALWRSWGVEPDAVVGHSMGEAAAAFVAGALSADAAARVICRRSELLRRISGRGAMAVVELSMDEARAALAGFEDRVSVAVSNSTRSSVLSGDPEAIDRIVATLEAREVFCRRVKVDVAAHSPQVEPLLGELTTGLGDLHAGPGRVPIYSTVLGGMVGGATLGPAYWARNLREPVRFATAVQALVAEGHDTFIEMGPHPVLVGALQQEIFSLGGRAIALASSRRDSDEQSTLLASLGALHVSGVPVDWERLYPAGRVVPLPAHAWQRQRFWHEALGAGVSRPSGGDHPVLGRRLPTIAALPDAQVWELGMSPDPLAVDPAALAGSAEWRLLEVVRAAAALTMTPVVLEEVAFPAPLVLGEGETRAVQVAISDTAGERRRIRVYAADAAPSSDAWTQVAESSLGGQPFVPFASSGDGDATQAIDMTDGPSAQRSLLSVVRALASSVGEGAAGSAGVRLVALQRLALDGVRAGRVEARATRRAGDARLVDVRFADASGNVVGEALGVRVEPWGAEALRAASLREVTPLLYEVAWRARALPAPRRTKPARWLILADRGGVGAALARRLDVQGHSSHVVYCEGGPIAGDALAIDPRDISAIRSAVVESWPQGASAQGVVHLWSLDAPAAGRFGPADEVACASALAAAQVLSGLPEPRPRLWCVTRGAEPAHTADVNPAQAPLWGLGRVVALEHPEIYGGLIDLSLSPMPDEGERLAAELVSGDAEDQVAFRESGRYVPRLTRAGSMPISVAGTPVRGDGSYLVTGGLGGLGLQVARWLVERGARHLVLTGRKGLPGESLTSADRERVSRIRDIESLGAAVTVVAADAADRERMTALFSRFGRDLPALRGVVHAAGVLRPAPLAEVGAEGLRDSMRSKVDGTWLLHELSREQPLDFLVLLSSGASVWGSKGLGHYAAANHFQDAFAYYRRAHGLPATCVNWGWWSGGGMETDEVTPFYRLIGLQPIASERALAALDRVVASGAVQAVVASVDWATFKPIYEAKRRRPILEEIRALVAAPVAESGDAVALREKVRTGSATDRRRILTEHVAGEVARLLGFATAGEVEPRVGFFKLGMDSIMTVQLRARLEAGLGLNLPPTVAFEYPTVEALAGFLLSKFAVPLAAVAGVPPPPSSESRAGAHIADQDHLSEDELTALLASKLREAR